MYNVGVPMFAIMIILIVLLGIALLIISGIRFLIALRALKKKNIVIPPRKCVCHTCGEQFEKKTPKRFLSMIALGARGAFWDFWDWDYQTKGRFQGCGKCPHCNSKDTALFNR